jgi:cyclophilin family peptidyl-prolyl cis-trans isomerase
LKQIAILLIAVLTLCLAYPVFANPRVRLETKQGIIILELDPHSAPKTVENFLRYVDSGFYNDTVFHRVIKGFMIQGGGMTADMRQKSTQPPVLNEADNGLKNLRGTIAMARTSDPHSATSQFFINTVDNTFLDHKGKTSNGWGYCVFGKVVEGMNVVDTIENTPTTVKNGHGDVPIQPIIIERTTLEE